MTITDAQVEIVKRARSRLSAMMIAPPSGIVSSQAGAREIGAALDALEAAFAAAQAEAPKWEFLKTVPPAAPAESEARPGEYTRLFNAIAAAVKIEGEHTLSVSVEAFQKAYGNPPLSASVPAEASSEVTELVRGVCSSYVMNECLMEQDGRLCDCEATAQSIMALLQRGKK